MEVQELIKKELALLSVNPSFSTRPEEEEPWLLSKQEEQDVIAHEIDKGKKHLAWRMAQHGLKHEEILYRLSEITDEQWKSACDTKEILRKANASKNYLAWQDSQREKEKKEAEAKQAELTATWTANQFYRLMQWTSESVYGKKLIANDQTMPLIKAICFFLSGDQRFETELSYDLKKGLIIRGISGLGKTHLVKCVADNPLNPVKVFSMLEIADEVKSGDAFEIGTSKTIYLDDVGTETAPVKYYGTDINWFKDFIELYYSGRPFHRLMLSTNNSFSDIEAKYGYRVRSRMKEMFNVIDIEGEDLRGV